MDRSNLAVGQSLPDTGFPRLTHVTNTGAVFGIFHGHSFALSIIVSIGVAAILAYGLFFSRRFHYLASMLGKATLGLVLGGSVGNLVDRLRLGHVTDFIDFGFWPAFNVADSAITVSIVIIAGYFIYLARTEESSVSG